MGITVMYSRCTCTLRRANNKLPGKYDEDPGRLSKFNKISFMYIWDYHFQNRLVDFKFTVSFGMLTLGGLFHNHREADEKICRLLLVCVLTLLGLSICNSKWLPPEQKATQELEGKEPAEELVVKFGCSTQKALLLYFLRVLSNIWVLRMGTMFYPPNSVSVLEQSDPSSEVTKGCYFVVLKYRKQMLQVMRNPIVI